MNLSASLQPIHTGRQARELRAGQVDIWLASTDALADRDAKTSLEHLDTDEVARWQSFTARGAARNYLAARRLVRRTLSSYADVTPESWRFSSNAYGRPRISSPAGTSLDFNISHTRGLVVCAVTRDTEIGVDVEWTGRDVDIQGIASHVFATEERAVLDAASPARRREIFFAYWTLKEAYLKARAMGFALSPREAIFDLSQSAPQVRFRSNRPDDCGDWVFFQTYPTGQHCLSLAVKGAQAPVDVTMIRAES